MRLRWFLLLVCAACAPGAGGARTGDPAPAVDAEAPGLRPGAHEVTLNGARHFGEMSRALFSAGLLRYRFTAHDRLTMPMLVIAGRHDGAAGPAGLRELARRLPNARFVEYDRGGHFVYLDEPQRFADDVSAFVRGR